MSRRRVATTWNPSEEPELEAYIATHSDNISAAFRRALRVGIRVLNEEQIISEKILEELQRISDKLDNMSFSGTVVKNETLETYTTEEIELDSMPSNIIANLRGMAK